MPDPRACPGSNVSLAEAAGHFGFTIPADATEVHFSSDLHPFFGEYSLQASFQTTPAGLHAFLSTAGLAEPAADHSSDYQPSVDGPSCGFGSASFSAPRYCEDDPETSTKPFQRQVAVDRADTARPRVVLSALDV
ncbi:hypothetical protein [Actinoallomurus vinaceus]|uniref:hypothetical protein n=1 Tax=Actinoallomurus vinaceus TaxID=1080074 RepID=UPI0031E6600E